MATQNDLRVGVRVEVPFCAFRMPHAREFRETYPVPPPSTVYGMLLSMVGEHRRVQHAGARIALAMLGEQLPPVSTVVRKVWRIKDAKKEQGVGENCKPDYVQVLSEVEFYAFIDSGGENGRGPTLAERVRACLLDPSTVVRNGGLSLGESESVVDSVSLLRKIDDRPVHWLWPSSEGPLSMPLWPDHVNGAQTRWGRFDLEMRTMNAGDVQGALVQIAPLSQG